MSTPPRISVIIPARDAEPTLDRTLKSLQTQALADHFEVIVVDDGSRDATPAIARRYEPLVSVISLANSVGPGAARNSGAAAARAGVFAFTDADCFPTPEWLAHGLSALEQADLVQGKVEPDPTVPRTPFDRSLWVDENAGLYQTANLFVRREVFESVGGFRDWALEQSGRRRWSPDRRRGRAMRTPIGEDTLFAWEARRLGATSAFAESALVHHAVVPGGIADALADRWHWTFDIPGLVRLVPELRAAAFYRRWFFAHWSAQFDLAVAGVAGTLLTGRKLFLLSSVPYLERVYGEAAIYRRATDLPAQGLRRAAAHALCAPIVSTATLAGFLAGSLAWRQLVI